MKLGISGSPVSLHLPYAAPINKAAEVQDFWPMVIYAVAYRETIVSQLNGSIPSAASYVSYDNGHGLCQLTSSWPDLWEDPETNAAYAIRYFLQPAVTFWNESMGYSGLTLLKCVFAEYNAGRGQAMAGHLLGDVDMYTSNGYAQACLYYFENLATKGSPV